ncbi:hypothetical protein CES86_3243 [Brucella lupini]|uniref:Uncharacterized protein n=1 Tax=Brucella lupini TaxID=255457 RepID=A0A256GJV0_9HYPH|nr:hypothetical protein CES86_3243 [Brucella lupini]
MLILDEKSPYLGPFRVCAMNTGLEDRSINLWALDWFDVLRTA